MCGLVALLTSTLPPESAQLIVLEALAEIAHRGEPQFQNEVWSRTNGVAGANRLALTSGSERQPATDDEGRYRIFLNGEIYSLHGMRNAQGDPISDTKALAIEAGKHGLEQALWSNRGMYALIAYESASDVWYLARDQFGIKPLYYSQTIHGILVASEIKALAKFPFVDEIKQVAPGELIRVSEGKMRSVSQSVAPVEEGARTLESQEYALRLKQCLDESVREQTRDGHCYGVYLSGGIDSSAIYALARENGADVVPIVIGWPGSPDVEAARTLATYFGDELHVAYCPGEEELFADIPTTIRTCESFEPNVVRQTGLSMTLAKYAKSLGLRAILCGEGADELFGGYPEFWTGQEPFGETRKRFLKDLPRTQLQRVDRANMAHTLEVRVPFLDPRVAALAFAKNSRTDFAFDDAGDHAKLPLRRAMADLLPEEILDRRKVVFSEGAGLGSNDPSNGIFASLIPDGQVEITSETCERWQLGTDEEKFYFSIFDSFGYSKYEEATERVFANTRATCC